MAPKSRKSKKLDVIVARVQTAQLLLELWKRAVHDTAAIKLKDKAQEKELKKAGQAKAARCIQYRMGLLRAMREKRGYDG